MQPLQLRSRFRNYSTSFKDKLSPSLTKIINKYPTHVLIDQNIEKHYQKELTFLKRAVSYYSFKATEQKKSLEGVYEYIEFLLQHKVQKKHVVLVIGGGLIQDIGSFTTHILLRGIDWIFIPTTLLAMSDSCIGSKSGINVGKYKNQVGSFHPPREIYIYPKFLLTLPDGEILTGIGEITKHALIKGGKAYEHIRENVSYLREKKDIKKMSEVIYESLMIKKEIVEEDEFEKGIRRLLNYGHTFGHAIEGYTKNKVPHGVAVSMGMDIANYISVKRGLLGIKTFESISKLLHKNIPYRVFPIKDFSLYLDYVSRDKKAIGSKVQAILCRGIGKIEIVTTDLDARLLAEIKEYSNKYPALHAEA